MTVYTSDSEDSEDSEDSGNVRWSLYIPPPTYGGSHSTLVLSKKI